MKSIHIAIAAATLIAAGFSNANEISEFPVQTSSQVSRAEVRAQAEAINKSGARHDFAGAALPVPMSNKTREEVRKEALQRTSADTLRSSYFVGGV